MKMLNKTLNVVKMVGGLVISIGVGAVATNLVKVTTPEDINKITKVCIGVGNFCVAGLASAAASDKFGGTIDQVINTIKTFTNEDNETEKVE